MKNLSTRQLASYLSVTKRTIQRKAIREQWPFYEQTGLGGTKRVYAFATLPENVKMTVMASIIAGYELDNTHRITQPGDAKAQTDGPNSWLRQHCFSQKMDATELTRDFIKLGILSLARLYVTHANLGKIKGFDQFCQLYNSHTLDIDREVFDIVNRVSRITLLRWEKNGLPNNDRRRSLMPDDELFDPDLKVMAEEVIQMAPTVTAKRLREHFVIFFADKRIPSENLIEQWISAQRFLL